jgi:flagellar biosynthesis component FlhA
MPLCVSQESNWTGSMAGFIRLLRGSNFIIIIIIIIMFFPVHLLQDEFTHCI